MLRLTLLLILIVLSVSVSFAEQNELANNLSISINKPEKPTFKQMLEKRYIRALVVYSKTDFFFDQGHVKGLQIEFLQQYEKYLNQGIKNEAEKIRIIFIPVTFSELIPALNKGKGDIAASLLTITPERELEVSFASSSKFEVRELLVRHKDAKPINKIEDLSGKTLYVLKNSSYIEHLQEINRSFKLLKLPLIKIEQADGRLLSEDILELVNSGIKKYTLIDDYKGKLWHKVLPNITLNKTIKIGETYHTGWAVRNENTELLDSLNAFSKKIKMGTFLGNMLFKRYFTKTKWINNPHSEAEQKKLSQFVTYFKKYGDMYNFDFLALLAQAYQESGLDNSKVSHRGAVGIMQLLPTTAADKNVAIEDFRNLEANIHAGTKYLAFIRNRYYSDPDIDPLSQLAFSWAAYNAGPAKVRDLRYLTKKMGLNHNRWFNNVEIAAGKVIGRETVRYVANIYKYYIAYKLSPVLEH